MRRGHPHRTGGAELLPRGMNLHLGNASIDYRRRGMFVPSDGPSRPAKSRRTCPFAWEPRSIEGPRSEDLLKHSETASSDLTDLDSSWSSSPPRTASSTPVPNSSLVNSSRASPSPSIRASPSPSIGSHLENIHLAADDDVLYVNAHLVSAPKSAPTTPASASRAAVPKATPPADKPRRPSSRLGLSLDGTAVLHELEAAAAAESRAAAVVARPASSSPSSRPSPSSRRRATWSATSSARARSTRSARRRPPCTWPPARPAPPRPPMSERSLPQFLCCHCRPPIICGACRGVFGLPAYNSSIQHIDYAGPQPHKSASSSFVHRRWKL